ncbi:hypothetical protein DPMN_149699 [Dreissena polymorpha]|uniref:Uncharacterized protein n=1 Tax=Dreissena polymorpha TaxID=45954 RepID=A0A9D4J5J8_DREPO|nr:hypothetical protein DPMN_149699 [Dreissena polymorpha]
MDLYMTQSSANRRTLDFTDEGRSLMKSRNRRGPRTDPLGTPEITGAMVEVAPSTTTC